MGRESHFLLHISPPPVPLELHSDWLRDRHLMSLCPAIGGPDHS